MEEPEYEYRGLIASSWDLGNKILAGLILVLVLGIYLYFSFWLE